MSRRLLILSGVLLTALLLLALCSWLYRGTVVSLILDNVHWTLGFSAAAVLVWSGRGSSLGPAEKSTRLWLALCLSVYAAGQWVWVGQVFLNWIPFPGPSDAFFLCMGPLLIVGLVRGWKVHHGRYPNRGQVLDTLVLTLGLMVLTLGFFLPHQHETEMLPLIVMILYPVLMFGTASLFAVLMLQTGSRPSPSAVTFFAALLGDAFLWMNWNLMALQGTLADGNPPNVLFSIFALLLGVAGLLWRWPPRSTAQASPALILLPLLGVLAAFAGSVILLRSASPGSAAEVAVATLSVLIIVLAIVSQARIVQTLRNAKETERALEQLRRTQGQLVRSEKLASMGQLIAGIAHELNTPLGSILSGTGTLSELFKVSIPRVLPRWKELTPESQAAFVGMLARMDGISAVFTTRSERELRKVLEKEAAEAGVPDPSRIAQLLLDTELAHHPELYRPLWRNPQILLLLEMLEPFKVGERMSQVLGQASAKASRVVSALRNYLHADLGDPAQCDLARNIESVLPLFQHRFKHNVEFVCDLPPGLFVKASAERLSQVWVNLITNALHAMGTNGTLRVEMASQDGWHRVQVTDSGPGVPEALRGRIFEPFFTTKAAGEGTGLGLGVCQTILEECGGRLELESVPGRTTFTVFLPIHTGQ